MKTLLTALLVVCIMSGVAFAQALEKAAIDSAAPPTTKPDAATEKARQAEADFEAGRTLFFQGQYKAAIEKLSAAAAAAPDKSSYRLLLAKARRFDGQIDGAAALLTEILKANPEHVEAGVELGAILLARGKYDEVIDTLERLLKFKHDYPLYHMLAESYYQKENLPKAREYFEKAVELNPQSGQDFYQLANIYLAQSRFARSADAYEKAFALGVDSAVLHFKLASVYFNLRRYLGRETTAQVIGGEPGQIKNQLLLIDPVPGQKDTFYVAPPASAIYQAVLARQMGIDQPELRFLEANIWLNARHFARADAIYKELQDKLKKEDQGLFWFYWSQAALGLDDYTNYLARLNKAIDAQPVVYKPTLADAYVTVSRRYQQKGDNAKYIEFLGKAVQTNPLSPGLHLALGDALWQLNEQTRAAEQYKLVLEIEPGHPDRVRLLNRVRSVEPPIPATQPAGK